MTSQRPAHASPGFDVRKIVDRSTLQRREREGEGGQLSRCGGSLDSLIDASRLDASFESDYIDPSPAPPRPEDRCAPLRESGHVTPRERSRTMALPRTKRPSSVVLTIGADRHLVPREVIDRFRDPSLQRVTPPDGVDPQIGVAYRFERNDVSDVQRHVSPLKASDDLSPVTRRRHDPDELRRKRDHRRHTVAGAGDSVEAIIAALTAVSPSRESPSSVSPPTSSSAWERLRPAMEKRAPRTMQSWLQQERMRQARSASDLLDLDDSQPPTICHFRNRSSEQTPVHRHPHAHLERAPLRRQIYSPAEQRAARRRMRRESSDSPVVSPTTTSARGPPPERMTSRTDNFTFESSL